MKDASALGKEIVKDAIEDAKEIVENKNVAAAIVAAAVILGVSIIIAASMVG